MTNWPCALWKPCDPQPVPEIVTAVGDALAVAIVVFVVGGVLLWLGLGRAG